MRNNATIPEKHLLEIIAERLGCTYLSDLKLPQYRERAREELRKGDFERIEVNEFRDACWYLSPPLKILLYGVEEDKALLLSWQGTKNHFSEILLYENYETYLSALAKPSVQAIICMIDGEYGLCAVKQARNLRPELPVMWFPESSDYLSDTFQLGCTLAGTKDMMNNDHLS